MKTGTPSYSGIRENMHKEAISRMFIAVLFTIVKNLNTFWMPTSRGAVKKRWHINTLWNAIQLLKKYGSLYQCVLKYPQDFVKWSQSSNTGAKGYDTISQNKTKPHTNQTTYLDMNIYACKGLKHGLEIYISNHPLCLLSLRRRLGLVNNEGDSALSVWPPFFEDVVMIHL